MRQRTHPVPSVSLSPAQVARFERDGYLVVEDLLGPSDLQPVVDEIQAQVERRAAELVARGRLSRTYSECGFERQLARIAAETDEVARGIWNGVLCGPAFFNLIRNPKLLDIAESFCGPEIVASSVYRLRPKIPNHSYGAVPWHQDSGYLEPYCDKATILTVWLPLVDANSENGCLWVIPGVHRTGEVLRHATRPGKPYLMIPEGALPRCQALCVPVRKGSLLLLHNLAPHASFENTSDVVRWSMDLRYQSAALPTNARITRLPGEVGPSAGPEVPLACYPPEADFLVRSKARPGEVVTNAQEFERLRRQHQMRPVTARWNAAAAQ